MTKTRRRSVLLAALASVMLVLSGCAALPKSGPVNEVQTRSVDDSPLVQQALGPVPGASPQRLVSDFVRACAAGTYDDFQVAKQYLTKSAAANWNPTQQVLVGTPGAQVRVGGEKPGANVAQATVSVALQSQGRVDRLGVYNPSEKDVSQTFNLVRDDTGQWRIADLPMGIVIPYASFNTAYTRRNVYFWGPGGNTLIPDPRYVSRRKLPQHLMLALLGGPAQTLAPAVTTAFAAGTTLSSNGVEMQDSVVTVDLSANVLDASKHTQALMEAQIKATFADIDDSATVSLSANGTPLVIKENVFPTQLDLQRLVGFTKEGLVETQENSANTRLPEQMVKQLGLTAAAVAPTPDGEIAAVGGRRWLYALPAGANYPRRVASGDNLGSPSVDRWGWIWVTRKDPTQSLIVSDMQGNRVEPELGTSTQLREVRISPDGVHFAALAENSGTYLVYLGNVVRDGKGKPRKVISLRSYELGQNNFTQLEWVNSTEIAVFAPGAAPLIRALEIHGFAQELNPPADAIGLFCGGPKAVLGVVDDESARQIMIGSVWRDAGSGIQNPRFPG